MLSVCFHDAFFELHQLTGFYQFLSQLSLIRISNHDCVLVPFDKYLMRVQTSKSCLTINRNSPDAAHFLMPYVRVDCTVQYCTLKKCVFVCERILCFDLKKSKIIFKFLFLILNKCTFAQKFTWLYTTDVLLYYRLLLQYRSVHHYFLLDSSPTIFNKLRSVRRAVETLRPPCQAIWSCHSTRDKYERSVTFPESIVIIFFRFIALNCLFLM